MKKQKNHKDQVPLIYIINKKLLTNNYKIDPQNNKTANFIPVQKIHPQPNKKTFLEQTQNTKSDKSANKNNNQFQTQIRGKKSSIKQYDQFNSTKNQFCPHCHCQLFIKKDREKKINQVKQFKNVAIQNIDPFIPEMLTLLQAKIAEIGSINKLLQEKLQQKENIIVQHMNNLMQMQSYTEQIMEMVSIHMQKIDFSLRDKIEIKKKVQNRSRIDVPGWLKAVTMCDQQY